MPWTGDEPHAGFSTAEPWLPLDPAHVPLAVDAQEADRFSTLNLTRRLVALRKGEEALRNGAIRIVDVPAPLLAFERIGSDSRLLCVFNLGDKPVNWKLPDGCELIEAVGRDATRGLVPPLAGLIARRG
jgi:alpha-glucosidase